MILGLVLGIGIPFLLLFLAALACCICSRKKTVTGEYVPLHYGSEQRACQSSHIPQQLELETMYP